MAPFVREGCFRLLDLPSELRIYVYSFLLPYNVVISHRRNDYRPRTRANYPYWIVEAKSKNGGHLVPIAIGRQLSNNRTTRRREGWPRVQTQTFLISRFVSNEAQGRVLKKFPSMKTKLTSPAVLYGSNTYEFTINGDAHFPVSLASPQIFGPFGMDDGLHLPLLRNLRSIHIELLLDTDSHWAVKRQRARLENFLRVLKQHSDDETRKSLLQELNVCVRIPLRSSMFLYTSRHQSTTRPVDSHKFMFGLESLSTLRGIKKVVITGVPEWYAKCLQTFIQGKGCEVLETDWPLVQVKRSVGSTKRRLTKKTKKVWATTRKWYQPTLNWKEFAERNEIDVPEDIDKFWMAEK
jgi:hypothetical protein